MSSLLRKLSFFAIAMGISATAGAAVTNLADAPIGSTIVVPANVILALSVEFPTGNDSAYTATYSTSNEYIGYFNPNYCYSYNTATSYFMPQGTAASHTCSGKWSGNFLNWALTQTIDPMRKALTGGYRIVDTPTVTVLQKAYADGSGGAVNHSLGSATLISGATPFTGSSFTINDSGTGLNFTISNGIAAVACPGTIPTGTTTCQVTATPAYPGDSTAVLQSTVTTGTTKKLITNTNNTYTLAGAVQVCAATDASSDLESSGGRCRAYGSNYKPVGLMQKYAAENTTQTDSIRYSAFGYLNDSDIKRDGGVMRARMKSVGPYQANPGSAVVANSNAEWSAADGTFFANPNSTDDSTVTNSGVVNYLNKFGTSGSYKTYDPVGELYYATTRYYRNLGNVASYTSGATDAMKDGFPVITTWDDPIKYTCSKNYIIGIGDIHTHADSNLPGATYASSKEPSKPAEVTADFSLPAGQGVDSVKATNWVGMLENQVSATAGGGTNDYQLTPATIGNNAIDSTAAPTGGWCCNSHSFLMAGLAYDVHTRDIRPDIHPKNAPINVSTFWVDVFESSDYEEKNQFWLTAKYGGFDTDPSIWPAGGLEYNMTAPPVLSAWNTGGYRDDSAHGNLAPDQYFQAGNPAKMIAGFNSAFAKIKANVPSGTSTALSLSSSAVTALGNTNYSATFAKDWSGDVVSNSLVLATAGGVITGTETVNWHARDWLPNKGGTVAGVTPLTASTRAIATSSSVGAAKGVAFTTANLSSGQLSSLGPDSATQTKVLNYVRGDQSNEGASPLFRPRTYTLGDITNSKPVVQAAPAFPYADTPLNPGYSTFKASNSTRNPVVYVGANDGMLHAIDGTSTGGKELFAYVPSFLLNTNADSQGQPVGLGSLVANPLQHHFMVDAEPTIIDVDFNRTGASGAPFASSVTPDWHSILISGLGKGGKGFFALDVTNPSSLNTDSLLANKVLWESGPSHMGYSYGTPLVIKTAKYGWTVVLTSGYGNDDGHGYIYLVSPKDGSVYETITTGSSVGSTTAPAGLAFVSGYINDFADYTADSLYAGDLLGNVWRVDLTSASANATIQLFATLKDSSGKAQPVTTEPVIDTDPATLTRYVFVGTGQLLADSDLVNPNQQTFYTFKDGNNVTFSPVSTPLTRTNLAAESNATLVAGLTLTGTQQGYYIDLATVAAAAGLQASAERVNIQPVAAGGVVSFAANLFGTDPCGAGGSRLFALTYGGTSLLRDASNNAVPSYSNPSPGVVTSLSIVTSGTTGGLQVLAGLSTGDVNGVSLAKTPASFQKLNWREVLGN
ncbi:pilus assembly protein [Pseudolysobacter antarcticus]|nr:PilC/PilY family type IV pilus protein [Pseudolysobacter antarcticus]